ncbi:hypothetical protein NBRC3280_2432 [Acetobacter pasteurianus NBRC 3280]|uniref:HTH cro/C1-type domain-containing protein n=3 Tax=Acetobacteraceae TaxID=433 RepID=A0A401WZA4_ACEPA|nr:hypothetical protein CSR02_03015 [Acetobacter pomorum]GCD57451.1 hypothetical protein NBRC3277_0026 [Acetobacter pasteurianus NBRC 3277]GCD60922.1 hypothetical protein NBRC3278_0015 [Acetobacter pasteurianus NBRC 3278]GCD69797.1 hypothetical protein NBRC3280_2432 [Acetobacter pasteurianus NBRC 3280]
MARAALKMGVRDLAQSAGVSPATITRIENGHPANLSTLVNLASTLELRGVICSIDDDGCINVKLLNNSLSEMENNNIQNELNRRREEKKRNQKAREWIADRNKKYQEN